MALDDLIAKEGQPRIEDDPEKVRVVHDVLQRSQEWADPEKWCLAYAVARDEEAPHEQAIEIADEFMRETESKRRGEV